jgi:hypothetical protein
MSLHVTDEGKESFGGSEAVVASIVRPPLRDVRNIGIERRRKDIAFGDGTAETVKALEGTGGSGTDGDDASESGMEGFEGFETEGEILVVHKMVGNLTLDGAERTGANMQSDFPPPVSGAVQFSEETRSEVQSCGRRCHRAADAGIDSLVSDGIARDGVTVEIRRQREAAGGIENPGEGVIGRIPCKGNTGWIIGMSRSGKAQGLPADMQRLFENALPPAAGVTEEAAPVGVSASSEGGFVMGVVRGETEYLHLGAGRAAEMQAGREDTAVVEDEEAAGGKIVREIAETCVGKLAMTIDKQAGSIAASRRVTGNQLVGEEIVVIGDTDIGSRHEREVGSEQVRHEG